MLFDIDLISSVGLQTEGRALACCEDLLEIFPGETVHSVLLSLALSDSLTETNELVSDLDILDVSQSVPALPL